LVGVADVNLAELTRFSLEVTVGISKPWRNFVGKMPFGIQDSQDVNLATDRDRLNPPHTSKSASIPSSAPWPVPRQLFANQIFRYVSGGNRPAFNNIC
jgi:hypothetical protein